MLPADWDDSPPTQIPSICGHAGPRKVFPKTCLRLWPLASSSLALTNWPSCCSIWVTSHTTSEWRLLGSPAIQYVEPELPKSPRPGPLPQMYHPPRAEVSKNAWKQSERLGLVCKARGLLLNPLPEKRRKRGHTTGKSLVHIMFQNGAAEIIAAFTSVKALTRS